MELVGAPTALTLDFETTNISKGAALEPGNRVVLCATKEGKEGTRIQLGCGHIGRPGVLIGHNLKFELQWLARLNVHVPAGTLIFDTMVAEYVLAGNRKWPLGLGEVCERYGLPVKERLIAGLMEAGVCPSLLPRKWLARRCVRDVETSYKLAQLQVVKLHELGLLPVFLLRCETARRLAQIEMRGLDLDPELVAEEYQKVGLELREAEKALGLLTGNINLSSPKQKGEYLYDTLKFAELESRGKPHRTAAGGRATDTETIGQLKEHTPEQRKFKKMFFKWSDLNARVTKALEFFKHVCEFDNSRFYGSLSQSVTQTHRLNSAGKRRVFPDGFEGSVQFQNFKRDYKRLFRAKAIPEFGGTDDDYYIVEGDGAKLEFVIAAGMAKDEVALKDIAEGADIHRFTASVLLRKPQGEVTSEERTEAKPQTFKPLYGGTKGTAAEERYFKAFREKYAGINRMQEGWVIDVLKHGYVKLPSGLRFYWKPGRIAKDGWFADRSKIYNYPIQSEATAQLMTIALCLLCEYIERASIRAAVVNTVHDSIVCYCHKDDLEDLYVAFRIAFLTGLVDTYYALFGVRIVADLGVELKSATHWGQGKGQSFTLSQEG